MSVISRATLPENFYDVTSTLLLKEPEDQYLYAHMYKAAVGAYLDVENGMGLTERADRVVNGVGARYASADRDRLVMADNITTSVFVPAVNFMGGPGTTMKFNRPNFENTTYTQSSRRIASGQSISTTPITFGSTQNSLTLERFAGPYDQTNGRVAPFAVDEFYAQSGVHNVVSMLQQQLSRDFDRTIETFNVALLDDAATVVRPAGMTDDNTATAAGQFPMDLEVLTRVELAADEANLAKFADGSRLYVATPKQIQQLKNDSDYQEASQYHPEYNILFKGQYISSVGGLHILKSNTLNKVDNTSSVAIHRGHLLTPGVLFGGMGRRPLVRSASEDNYGINPKVIWEAPMAFGLADNRFCISVRTSE